ncbi:MAG TPA: DNA polymerase domain-containing protein [Candidatus Bathyarchaeia archaeon]|nr:DNA polymerase domain-containing protein [Candidatus Bathyarchaeia archaeon]
MTHSGWILDLYHRPGQMVIWLKKTDGSCVRLTDPWKPKIHIGGSFRDLLDLACRPGLEDATVIEMYEKAGDRERSRVLEVEVDGDQEALGLAKKLEQYGRYSKFRFYDVDVPSPQMYLYRKNLFPLAFVEAEETSRGISWTLKDSRESIDYELPLLRQIDLEINTEKTRKIRSFNDKLASVHFTRDEEEILAIDSGDETDKILGLVEAFSAEDPDVVVTSGGDSFIFPYLARRAQELGILDQLILGRDISPLRVYEVQGHSYFSYGKILYRETAARLLGRLHVDQKNAYVSADCGLEGLFEVSRTCIMPIQRASRATIGTNMTSLQLYHAVKRDVLIPWNKNQPEELKDNGELVVADRGGFIYEPKIGIHDHVGELDFASLYPTLMTKMNLSGETVNCTCCPDSANRVPELEFNICERSAGIVPLSLKILLDKRSRYKVAKKTAQDEEMKTLYERRQAALKWILVCSFGYLGFKNARFGKIDAHIATCAFSRQILGQAAALAEARGFKLVHGIVDSFWLKKPEATREEYEDLCSTIRKELCLPISFEGTYRWIVFLSSKTDSKVGVLNRYYGIFEDGKPKVRGIDLRRHDTPDIVRKCQTAMLNILTKAQNSNEFRLLIPQALKILENFVVMLREGSVPLENLVIVRNLSKNPDEYTHQVPQAIAARQLVAQGGSVHAGQQVSYILTQDHTRTAVPPEIANEGTVYDSERYVDLLCSSVANLLLPLGYDAKYLRSMFKGTGMKQSPARKDNSMGGSSC